MERYCPKCSQIELKIVERQGVEIDYCPECNGIWLDNGELNKIIKFYLERNKAGNTQSTTTATSFSTYPKDKGIKKTKFVTIQLHPIFAHVGLLE